MPLLPTSFLPPLGRPPAPADPARSPFPIPTPDLLGHISILRELYLPPIHGGLRPEDTQGDSDLHESDDGGEARGSGSTGPTPTVSGAATPMPLRNGRGERGKGSASILGLDLDKEAILLGSEPIQILSTRVGPRAPAVEDTLDPLDDEAASSGSEPSSSDSGEGNDAHLDPFERDWAEKWLNNLVRRAQTWLEAHQEESSGSGSEGLETGSYPGVAGMALEVERVQRESTACLAMMAGTSAAGSLTRHLLFPLHPSLVPALRANRRTALPDPNLSPETSRFLASLSISPSSPTASLLRRQSTSTASFSPNSSAADPRFAPSGLTGQSRRRSTDASLASTSSSSPSRRSGSSGQNRRHRKSKRPGLPVLLHDAPMGDHLSVGVQTWGSAILLGREMARHPRRFGLARQSPSRPDSFQATEGVRVLELGAGTGLLSILCRKLLDLQNASARDAGIELTPSVVVATDFLPSVLDNLKICLDLNFPAPPASTPAPPAIPVARRTGLHIAKLDWSTFPAYMSKQAASSGPTIGPSPGTQPAEELAPFIQDGPFDLVLASDCVYDPTHARMLREVVGWVLRLPPTSPFASPDSFSSCSAAAPGVPALTPDPGGTFHILSPLRPTFTPELESIDANFPLLSSYPPLSDRAAASDGEGLGKARGLRIGARGQGKKGMRGKRGEGRTDEVQGYWWWEIGWG